MDTASLSSSTSVAGAVPGTCSVEAPACATSGRKAQQTVGLERLSHTVDDAEWFGVLAAQANARYERTGCLSAAGDRDRWLLAQREAQARTRELVSPSAA